MSSLLEQCNFLKVQDWPAFCRQSLDSREFRSIGPCIIQETRAKTCIFLTVCVTIAWWNILYISCDIVTGDRVAQLLLNESRDTSQSF